MRFKLKTETDADGNVVIKTPALILQALKNDHLIPPAVAGLIQYDESPATYGTATDEEREAAEKWIEGGVINVNEYEDNIFAHEGDYAGHKFEDIFDDFFAGVRICFIPPYNMFEHIIGTTPYQDYQITEVLGNEFSPESTNRHRAFGNVDRPSEFPKAPQRAIPIVSAEKSYKGKDAITEFAEPSRDGTLNWFAPGMIDCLIADLTNKVEYKTLFGYCLSFARFNSIWATYTINAFLPSIGSAAEDYKKVNTIGGPKWKDAGEIDDPDAVEPTGDPSNADEFGGVGTGNDGWIAKPTEAGGGQHITFTPGFRSWDRNTFKRSKKYARVLFNTSYKGSDSEYENDIGGAKADRKNLRSGTNLDLGFGWLFKKRQVPKPPEECD